MKVGTEVKVIDEGLEMLMRICPDMPPNNLGRVEEIWEDGDMILVEFPIDGSYEHSQSAPYPKQNVIEIEAT